MTGQLVVTVNELHDDGSITSVVYQPPEGWAPVGGWTRLTSVWSPASAIETARESLEARGCLVED